jgi:predicted Rossmann fold nucleotide-binding protein DprA/Smf involved in DNA uptake
MSLSPQAQAVVLLTAHLAKAVAGEPRPLSPREWGRFALWLKDHALQPESLLSESPSRLLAGLPDEAVTVRRVETLLSRGGALGLALEKWERAGLWVMTRSDADYPDRLKRRLRTDSPPLLFGVGDRGLLGRGRLAVVGSRDAGEGDIAFAGTLGAEASRQGLAIVSGGARGIDEAAMRGALENDGTAVGVLADNLLRMAISAKYRKHLMAKNLVLVSPYNPEAGFSVGNAMARNRYIYCLADAAVVVASTPNQGGTWTGALENLKEGWVPLWVQPQPTAPQVSGNAGLVRRGARWLPDGARDLSALMVPAQRVAEPEAELFFPEPDVAARERKNEAVGAETPRAGDLASALGFYEIFLLKVKDLTVLRPLTLAQLQERLDVSKPQLNAWLKRAAAEGRIERVSRPSPVRYHWQGEGFRQFSIFSDEREAPAPKTRKTRRTAK